MDHTVVKERSCQKAKFRKIKLHNQYLKTQSPTIIFFTTPESAGFLELNFHNHWFLFFWIYCPSCGHLGLVKSLNNIFSKALFSHFWEHTVVLDPSRSLTTYHSLKILIYVFLIGVNHSLIIGIWTR